VSAVRSRIVAWLFETLPWRTDELIFGGQASYSITGTVSL